MGAVRSMFTGYQGQADRCGFLVEASRCSVGGARVDGELFPLIERLHGREQLTPYSLYDPEDEREVRAP
jgi:hypothetical protein